MANQFDFEFSATDPDATVNLEALDIPAPRSTYAGYSEQVKTQSGAALGVGWKSATWTWDYLTAAQFAVLRGLFPAASTDCWVRTPMDDGTYSYFSATAIFPPPPYQQRAGRTLQIEISIINLTEYTPTP